MWVGAFFDTGHWFTIKLMFFFRFSTNCEMDTVRVEGVSSIESIVGLCSDAFTNCGVVSWSWWMVCVEWE